MTSSAKFGRMEFTRCTIVQDFIGCENDVLFLMDKWCSGRSRCHTIIPNDDLIASNIACLPYLRMYLRMQYSCLKGMFFLYITEIQFTISLISNSSLILCIFQIILEPICSRFLFSYSNISPRLPNADLTAE